MLLKAAERVISRTYVPFDIWYTSKNILSLLEELGWKYAARIKRDRLFDGDSVGQKWPHRFGQATRSFSGH